MLFIGGHYNGQDIEISPSARQCRMPIPTSLEPDTLLLDGPASPIRIEEEVYVRKTIFFRGDYHEVMVESGLSTNDTLLAFMQHMDCVHCLSRHHIEVRKPCTYPSQE